MSEYINGYALALFSIAKEEKKLEIFKEESDVIIKVFFENPEYMNLLNKKLIAIDERKKLVIDAFEKIDKNILNFIFLLLEKSKINLIVSILKKLIKLINNHLNINEGIVYTYEELTSSQLVSLTKKISERIGVSSLILVNKIDRELVSGIKVVVNDEIIEDSIYSRLEQLHKELLIGRKES